MAHESLTFEQRQLEIQKYLEVIRFLSESTDDYIYLMDLDTGNAHFCGDIQKKYNLPENGPDGYTLEDWKKVIYKRDCPAVMNDLELVVSGQKECHNMEYRLIDRNHNRVWISCRGKVRCDSAGQPLLMLGRVSDTVLGGKTDSLTGLLNARKFVEDINGSLRQENSGCLLILGIDNFMDVNIKYGRTFGNQLLKKLTEILEDTVDPAFLLYRLDGDRFGTNLIGRDFQYAENIYNRIQEQFSVECTLSAGAVLYGPDMPVGNHLKIDGETLFQYAENALIRAKKGGKNMLVRFSSQDYEERLRAVELIAEMRASIRNDFKGFFVCYQPQVDCRSSRIYGVEALLRFCSPTRGIISPVEFIPLLEQSKLIIPVGKWVLETALGTCREWRREIPELHVSVNVSYVQLEKEGIAESVLESLRKADIPGEALTLELTESVQLQNYQYFNRIFNRWRKAGIQISIDDFGTGYSSLSYLKSIEVNEIKIDRCFISGIQHSAYNYRLLSNTIELAKCTQIRVCCEGVETEEELMVLQKLMPETLQGFLFSKPCRKEEFENSYIHSDTEVYRKRVEAEEKYHPIEESAACSVCDAEENEELRSIVDNLEEMIFVSDIDTFELYYINAAGRRLTGVYDYKNRKCHEVLFGRDKPCEFCTNCHLFKEAFQVHHVENDFLDCSYFLKEKEISWHRRVARLSVAAEVDKRWIVDQRDVLRQNDFYKAMLSETVAYAEIDLYSGRPLAAGGFWLDYQRECRQSGEAFLQVLKRHLPQHTPPEDVSLCSAIYDAAAIQELYAEGQSTQQYCFRRFINGSIRWVSLVIHVFEERSAGDAYALLYLKDVDIQKRHEPEQESALNTDPLTKVFNRKMFEQLVCDYMRKGAGKRIGTLIIFDIDDFKSINDRFGHPEGDVVLLRVTEVLQSTFRQGDIVGRLGGDEFVAFIKNVTKRDILNRRIENLSHTLSQFGGVPITCCSGITFLSGEHFSYEQSMKEAVLALDQGKQRGKNQVCYYEDIKA